MIGDTVVVIDDEPEVLGLLQDILQDAGYQVVAVNHPMVIYPAIAAHEPSLFLIDIMLPGVSGITVAEQLRMGAYGTIPLLAMSASPTMTRRATGSGWFTDTLEKPFDVDDLLECVAQHLAA